MTTKTTRNAYAPSAISVVVPTYNEVDNVENLVKRVDKSLKANDIEHEFIFIDDHSSDGTVSVLERLRQTYPIRIYSKIGKRGKAFSLLEGFEQARKPFICMIDGDLQYPPEAIAPMARALHNGDADVVVTTRMENGTPFMRRLASKTYNLLFVKLLFGIDYDTQSGLKVFRRDVLKRVQVRPSPWSFDLEFIIRCLQNRFKILKFAIPFSEREHGEAKVGLVSTTIELIYASLKLRFKIGKRSTVYGAAPSVRQTFAQGIPKLQKTPSSNWLTVLIVAGLVGILGVAAPLQAQADAASFSPLTIQTSLKHVVDEVTGATSGTSITVPGTVDTSAQAGTSVTTPGKGGGGVITTPTSTPTVTTTTAVPTTIITTPDPATSLVTPPATPVQTTSPPTPVTPVASTTSPSPIASSTTPDTAPKTDAAPISPNQTISQPVTAQTASSAQQLPTLKVVATAPNAPISVSSTNNASTAAAVSANTLNLKRPIAGSKTAATNAYPATHLSPATTAFLKSSAKVLLFSGLGILFMGVITIAILGLRRMKIGAVHAAHEPYPHEHLKASLRL